MTLRNPTREARGLPLLLALAVLVGLVGCGSSTQVSTSVSGVVTTTLSDPPTCRFAPGAFRHIWITVTDVRAHISAGAQPEAGGWQDLTPGLADAPQQVDLLGAPTGCTLALLGSTSGLPVGQYQQIRFILLSNNPASGTPTPGQNNCGSQGFNCVELADGSLHRLKLSSEANTGIKIPPGQIAGGALTVEAGEAVDVNIDFNACASIVVQGGNLFRLLPSLHAGEVSLAQGAISGRVVDTTTGNPIAGGTVLVAAEQPDAGGIDRVIMQTRADANGNFNFCPLPEGNYDIVATAIDGSGVTYNATITFAVPVGTSLGDIPLEPETGTDTGPGTLTGTLTTSTGSTATSADIALSALQTATPEGGSAVEVSIPLLGNSTPNVATASDATCPVNTNCATYTLLVPASNPSVGTFSSDGTTYAAPATGAVNYKVSARASVPSSGGLENCSPAELIATLDSSGGALAATPNATTTVETLDFTGCQAGF
ncbi:MAG: DUF4382 domain-containing protein [Terriglobia bacterium]